VVETGERGERYNTYDSTTQIQIKNVTGTSHLESDALLPRAYKPSFNVSLEDAVDYHQLVKSLLEQFLGRFLCLCIMWEIG